MSYDIFLSHNHADKAFVRTLHDSLARTDHNGRFLRVWLDEHILDPGPPSSDRELHGALDRSRFLVLVLSPESAASPWVQSEIEYFLGERSGAEAVIVRRRPTPIPAGLEAAPVIEWPEAAADGEGPETERRSEGDPEGLARLRDLVRPGPQLDEAGHRRALRRAWKDAMWSQPEGFDPTPTQASAEANGRLADLLLRPSIADPDTEGEALVGFDAVGFFLSDIDGARFYGSKMVVGELLALAMSRDHRYRQVATRYLDQETEWSRRPSFMHRRNRANNPRVHVGPTTNLAFAVARAASKLAEIDPASIDLSTLWAVLDRLDRRLDLRGRPTPDESALAMMVGRALGKQRNTAPVDVLVATLARWGGPAGRLAAGTAISAAFDERDPPVFYLPELEVVAGPVDPGAPRPPSPVLAKLLLDGPLHDPLDPEMVRCHDDLVAAFGDDWTALPGRWPPLRYSPVARRVVNGPLAGTVRLATLANMEELAESLRPSDLVALTEPRIVDTLLDRAGGFLLDDQADDSPLCLRLAQRGQRLAVLRDDRFATLAEGDRLTIPAAEPDETSMGLMVPAGSP